jgi:hypothetical protein
LVDLADFSKMKTFLRLVVVAFFPLSCFAQYCGWQAEFQNMTGDSLIIMAMSDGNTTPANGYADGWSDSGFHQITLAPYGFGGGYFEYGADQSTLHYTYQYYIIQINGINQVGQPPITSGSGSSGCGTGGWLPEIYMPVTDMSTNVAPPCTTNWTAYANDPYTNNDIIVTAYLKDGTQAGQMEVPGPLVNLLWNVGTFPCTNVPGQLMYSNLPPCMAPVVFNCQNDTAVWRIFAVEDVTSPGQALGEQFVAPTNWYYYSNSVPCANVGNFHLFASGIGGDDSLTDTGLTPQGTGGGSSTNSGSNAGITTSTNTAPNQGPGTGNSSSGGGGTVTNNVPPVQTAGNLPTVNPVTNQIIYSNTNTDPSQIVPAGQTGNQAIYNAVNTAAAQNHSDAAATAAQNATNTTLIIQGAQNDANGIIAAINAASALNHADLGSVDNTINGAVGTAAGVAHSDASSIVKAIGALTNGTPNTLTNYALESTQSIVATNTAIVASNSAALLGTNSALAQGVGALTNTLVGMSNLMASGASLTNGLLGPAMTNADQATAVANSYVGPVTGVLDGIVAALSPPDVGEDPGHSSAWEFNFCGTHLDCDPVDMFPSVVVFSKGFWNFVLIAAYLFSVAKQYYKIVELVTKSQTGGVPNLTFTVAGFGGNALGIGVAALVALAFVALWIVVVTVVITPVASYMGFYSGIAGVFSAVSGSTSGQCGMHLLFAFFPVSLAMQLVTARLVLMFTMSKAAIVAVFASRFLIGK